jgi:FkbM family methyltransferase
MRQVVFDVGASVGDRTAVYIREGCEVLAWEPHRRSARRLINRFGTDCSLLRVLPWAAGPAEGMADFYPGTHPALSTLNVAVAREQGAVLTSPQQVRVSTLDSAITRLGRAPDLVKIDVEGYEAEVLRGLSSPVPVISFEAWKRDHEATRRAVLVLVALGTYEFNFTCEGSQRFRFKDWSDADDLLDRIRAFTRWDSGEVYARLRGINFRLGSLSLDDLVGLELPQRHKELPW